MTPRVEPLRVLPLTLPLCAGVHAVAAECFADPWSLRAFEEELQNPRATTLTAVEGDRVAGFVNAHLVWGECSLNNIAVSSPFRRRGAASLLLSALIGRMRGQAEFIALEVRPSNAPAIALYQRFGFQPVGRRRQFYLHPTEDALLMTLTLTKE